MREILFRGKLLSKGRWAEGNLDIKKSGVCIITPDETPLGCYGQVDPETVGQYTGLNDVHGKRIFEGDIVKATHTIHFPAEEQHLPRRAYGANYTDLGEYVYARNYVVKWNEKSARWEIRNGSDSAWVGLNYVYNHAVEVIGNIYDNPYMIGGKEE